MKRKFFAHSKEGCPPEEWRLLEDHLSSVAKLASQFASKFCSTDWAWNAGWLHDLGKAANEFQAYLLRENGLDDAEYDGIGQGRVKHYLLIGKSMQSVVRDKLSQIGVVSNVI